MGLTAINIIAFFFFFGGGDLINTLFFNLKKLYQVPLNMNYSANPIYPVTKEEAKSKQPELIACCQNSITSSVCTVWLTDAPRRGSSLDKVFFNAQK